MRDAVCCCCCCYSMDVYTVRDDVLTYYAGKNQLVALLSWLDYCDQLATMSSAPVAAAISSAIRRHFLDSLMRAQLLQRYVIGYTSCAFYRLLSQTGNANCCSRLFTNESVTLDSFADRR